MGRCSEWMASIGFSAVIGLVVAAMTRETECMIDMQVLPGLTRYHGKMIGSDVQVSSTGLGVWRTHTHHKN